MDHTLFSRDRSSSISGLRPRGRQWAVWLLVVGIGLVVGSISEVRAQSESSDSETSKACPTSTGESISPERLIVLGVECFRAGQYGQAYTYYSRAQRQTSTPALTAALGRSLHKLGIYHVARRKYEAFLESASSDGENVRKIEQRLEQLKEDIETKGVRVRFRSFPSDARVYVQLDNGDWSEVGRTPFTGILERERYEISVDKPEYRRRTRTLSLEASRHDRESVRVELVSQQSPLNMTARTWKRAGWITGLSSLGVLAGATAFLGLTWSKYDEVDDYVQEADYVPATRNRLVEQAHRFQRGALILTGLGGTGLATGVLLYLRGATLQTSHSTSPTSPDPSTKTTNSRAVSQPRIHPVITLRYLGIRATW